MFCDLHTHSVFSDGTDTPEALIRMARSLGLGALALTDHNTPDGLPRFLAAEHEGLELVPGVEFSTDYLGGELHILALFVRPEDFGAVRELAELPRRRKRESNLELARNLTQAGYPIDYEALERATPGGQVNRAHFAAELTRLGHTSSMDQAFRQLLTPEAGLYHPPRRLDALETIRFIRALGAVSVLAHPFLNLDDKELETFLRLAVPAGLDAMEARYSKFDDKATRTALALAERFGLLCSGGSDYHGANKPGLAMGSGYGNLAVPMEYYEKLAALAEERQGNKL